MSDDACREANVAGTCSCGHCSYPASSCPSSNLQWSPAAPAAIASRCVPVVEHVDTRVYHTCATMSDGSGWCWGWNSDGQLGPAQPIDVDTSVPVVASGAGNVPLADVEVLRTGASSTCALSRDGSVACWGSNEHGQLGGDVPTGPGMGSQLPVPVLAADGAPLSGVTQLSVGFRHACALVEGAPRPDAVYCWGSSSYRQTGQVDPITPRATEVSNLPAGDIKHLAAGGEHTCAIVLRTGDAESRTLCWGRGADGRLGNASNVDVGVDVPQVVKWNSGGLVADLPAMQRIAAGNRYTCGVKQPPGELYCWGKNESGALGIGMTQAEKPFSEIAVRVIGPNQSYDLLAADDLHTCSATSTQLECWGSDANGTIGDGEDDGMPHLTPTTILTGKRLVDLSAGFRYTCMVDDARQVHCWGENMYGGLGDGTMIDRHGPTAVASTFCPAL